MKTSPASNMDVKRRNRANTLRCILSCKRISQMELAQRLDLTWNHVSVVLVDLSGQAVRFP